MLEKLYRGDTEQILKDIIDCYKQQDFAVVNFLYFANAMQYHLFEEPQNKKDIEYKHALLGSDFLLPDGIALQLWDYVAHKPKSWVSNLNGTDLTPRILEYITEKYTVELYIASLYDERIWKWKEWLEIAIEKFKSHYGIQKIHGFQTHFTERWSEYPWEEWTLSDTWKEENVCRIVMHCTWTPFQELWTEQHKDWYQKNKMLVLNVWGFVDFFSGFEQRAPERVVRARVLETFWRITTNPKKNLKKFIAMFWIWRVILKNVVAKMKNLLCPHK